MTFMITSLGCTIFNGGYYIHYDPSTKGALTMLLTTSMGCLSGSLPFLLGYIKKHARDCFEEPDRPRKMLILLLFSFIILGLVLQAVRLYSRNPLTLTQFVGWIPP